MLDLKTGLLVWALEAVTLSMVLFALWFGMRKTGAIVYWSLGFGLHGFGIGAVALRGHIPDFLSIQVANTAALTGIGLWLAGIMVLDKRRVSPAIMLPALIWTTGMLIPEISGTFWARVVLFHLAAAIGFTQIALAVMHDRKPGLNARTLMAGLQYFQAVRAVATIYLTLIERPASFEEMDHVLALTICASLSIVGSLVLGTRLVTQSNEDHLRDLAETDPLTGLLNRRGLANAFGRLTASSARERPMVAAIQLDLDRFKQINDRHGHHIGDAVLVTFARLTNALCDAHCVAGRLGGEEFACLMRVGSAADAVAAAGRIRAALRHTPIAAGGAEISVSASAGISLAAHATASLDAMLMDADRALYAAKHAGRDRIGLDCEHGVEIVSAEDEAVISDSTDRQVAALNRMGIIGRA